MPAAANKAPGDVILASEWNTLATTANNGESGAASATTTANAASTAVATKYTKPAQGIPLSDVVTDGIFLGVLWNGTNWVTPGGTVATAANRPANSLRIFVGGPDAGAAGVKNDGDIQVAV